MYQKTSCGQTTPVTKGNLGVNGVHDPRIARLEFLWIFSIQSITLEIEKNMFL